MNYQRCGVMWMAAGLTLLAAGCGGGSGGDHVARVHSSGSETASPTAGNDSTQAVLDEYIHQMTQVAECYRKNGLPDVPDPDQFGQVMIDTRNLTSQSDLHRARTACASLQVPMPPEVRALVAGEEAASLTDQQRAINQAYAECMQANGAADFPDPLPNGLPDESTPWNQGAAGAQRALADCASVVGAPAASGAGVG